MRWGYCGTPGLRGSAHATAPLTQLCAASIPPGIECDGHPLCLTVAPPDVASNAAHVRHVPRSEHAPGVESTAADNAHRPVAGPACVSVCCLVIGLLLRLRSNRAGRALHGCKPRVWRRAAGCPRPPSSSRGQRFGMRRAVPLLLLAAWLGVCSANHLADVPDRLDSTRLDSERLPRSSACQDTQTICSVVPSACDGTYNGRGSGTYNGGTTLNFNEICGKSESQLSGSFPTQLGVLTALKALSLSESKLSGSIPTQIGALTALEALNLGGNHLSGSLPSQLGTLKALAYQWATARLCNPFCSFCAAAGPGGGGPAI